VGKQEKTSPEIILRLDFLCFFLVSRQERIRLGRGGWEERGITVLGEEVGRRGALLLGRGGKDLIAGNSWQG